MVNEHAMPQRVPEELYYINIDDVDNAEEVTEPEALTPAAVAIYTQLKEEFGISHTEMAKWLDVTRRSLYYWKSEPERATKVGPQIEARLISLSALRDEMEPEHRSLLFKIAFSPIYGDPRLGEAIFAGASSEALIEWYDMLFSQFESYRSTLSHKEQVA